MANTWLLGGLRSGDPHGWHMCLRRLTWSLNQCRLLPHPMMGNGLKAGMPSHFSMFETCRLTLYTMMADPA